MLITKPHVVPPHGQCHRHFHTVSSRVHYVGAICVHYEFLPKFAAFVYISSCGCDEKTQLESGQNQMISGSSIIRAGLGKKR